jgi:hypothetical protein
MTTLYSKSLYILLFYLFSCKTLLACECFIPTTEEEYKRSELVMKGRMIGMDTIVSSNSLTFDRHGTRFGRHKYSLDFKTLIRVKLVVEENYKSLTTLSDTIYILSPVQNCGFQFPPYIEQLSPSIYDFIVYGDQWIENSIEKARKGKHQINQIKMTPIANTFYSGSCRLTQYSNSEEQKKLEKIKT